MATDTVWTNIQVDSLSQDHQDNYASYKAAYALMKEARNSFEEGMRAQAGLPTGQRLVFGYNFGKLSLAVVKDESKPKASQPKGLGEFLAAQQSAGRSA